MSEFEVRSAINKLITTLTVAKDISTPKGKMSKKGLTLRTPEVVEAGKAKKEAFWIWKCEGRLET